MKPIAIVLLAIALAGCGPSAADQAELRQRLFRVGKGIRSYADDHTDRFPDTLADLKSHLGDDFKTVMTNPITGEFPAWKYVKPADRFDELRYHSKSAIVYELLDGQMAPAGLVLFADMNIVKMEPQ